MNISILAAVGPVMIGPSSSHTAGAARLANVARTLAPQIFLGVSFALSGSFAKTGKGHGTDKALLAGALGILPDDEALCDAFTLAKAQKIAYDFSEIELPESHENTARLIFHYAALPDFTVEGSSIGGGRILITNVNGAAVQFSAEVPTLIITQRDVKGVVSEISSILAERNINIGVMRLSREAKGALATTILETDANVSAETVTKLTAAPNILSVCSIDVEGDL